MHGDRRPNLSDLACLALTGTLAFGEPAYAFAEYGLTSGMTTNEVQSKVPPGFNLVLLPALSTPTFQDGLIESNDGQKRVFASVAFCRGRLVSVIRNVDPDTEWLPAVEQQTREHGTPAARVTTQAWTGPGGGMISNLHLRWSSGMDRIDIEYTPTGRDGSGALRYERGASIDYSDVGPINPCFGEKAP